MEWLWNVPAKYFTVKTYFVPAYKQLSTNKSHDIRSLQAQHYTGTPEVLHITSVIQYPVSNMYNWKMQLISRTLSVYRSQRLSSVISKDSFYIFSKIENQFSQTYSFYIFHRIPKNQFSFMLFIIIIIIIIYF